MTRAVDHDVLVAVLDRWLPTGKIAHFELGYIPESAKELKSAAGFLITNHARKHIMTLPRAIRKRNVYEEVARFLTGAGTGDGDCEIVDIGHVRERDLQVVVPPSPLEAVMSNEVKEEVYDQIAALVREHRTTLIFVNTRRMAERAAREEPRQPTVWELRDNGRTFPPNYLHESWRDYLYWDSVLES